jgi:LacI family transcriptional regulator
MPLRLMARVTIKQVAAEAGVHFSTVSLALRNDPRLRPATRERIRQLAERMGYVPDAMMRALCAYRSATRPKDVHSGLAYLVDQEMKPESLASIVYRSAARQAERLGYRLIPFNLREKGMNIGRLQAIWRNSGLRGVLIGPMRNPNTVLDGDWGPWITVAYGFSVSQPRFHRAVFDHFQNMLAHLEELRKRGYRRIGLSLPQRASENTRGMLHAAYLLDQSRNGPERPIPIFSGDPKQGTAFERWVRREKLDVLISYASEYDVLVERGWRIPGQLGFSLLSTWSVVKRDREELFAGFDTKVETLASNAVNFLVSLIHEQAYGVPDTPRSTMITGAFRDGPTLRPAGPEVSPSLGGKPAARPSPRRAGGRSRIAASRL